MSHQFMPITDNWLLEQMMDVDNLSNSVILFLWFLHSAVIMGWGAAAGANSKYNVSSVPKHSGQN